MILRMNDRGVAVKSLQRGLNKFGTMLLIDGEFGISARDAVADVREALSMPGSPQSDDEFQSALASAPDPFPPLTAPGVTFIARAEVGDAATYRKKFQTPCWPSPKSGVTVGIGYDCQFVSAQQFRTDWGGLLKLEILDRLVPVCQERGSNDLLASAKDVIVPLLVAMSVFVKRSLPSYLERTRGIYPQVDSPRLRPAQRTALVSLVYNRGTRLIDDDRQLQDRREMREIRRLLAVDALDAIPAQFEAMTRLWDGAKLSGLISRRRAEAALWRGGFSAVRLH